MISIIIVIIIAFCLQICLSIFFVYLFVDTGAIFSHDWQHILVSYD